jgi:type 1 glutamine amidotransferase
VLATGKSLETGKEWPVVFTVAHPKARIVGITLGHDGAAHDGEPYQKLLKNAAAWAAKK